MAHEPTSGRDGSYSRRRVLLGATGTMLSGLAGCIARGEDSGLKGEIVIDGSDTLLPNSAAVARRFQWENNQVRVSVRGSGTGAGFQRLCRDEIDLGNASRRINDSEEQLCTDNGVDWLELDVVMDGIAIMKHPHNDWCESLTMDELRQLWESDSEIETWQDLDAEWPDEEISFYGRDSASGTFDYFTEALTDQAGNIRSDYTGTADTNQIVRGVRGDRYAVGFGGAGYYYENEDDVDLIALADDETMDAIEPSEETIADESYPLARPMFLYVNLGQLVHEEFREFVQFYLDTTQETALDVGFYSLSDERLADQQTKFDEEVDQYT